MRKAHVYMWCKQVLFLAVFSLSALAVYEIAMTITAPKPGARTLPRSVLTERVDAAAARSIAANKYDYMAAAGIPSSEWGYVDYIVTRESSWRPHVWNTLGSGAYGLCQALPARKMATAGPDYMTNAITQLKWCDSYAKSRYGSWAKAYQFWTRNHWW